MRRVALTILGRTYLLSLAALCVATGTGMLLALSGNPTIGPPASIDEIARRLLGEAPGDHRGMPPLPPFDMPADIGVFDIQRTIREAEQLPEPLPRVDTAVSARLQARLVARLGAAQGDVCLEVERPRWVDRIALRDDDDFRLRLGFIAALRRDGHWRIVESRRGGLRPQYWRRALWLLGAGLLVMLPTSWLFARALSAPIRRFADAARRMGEDPLTPPLERRGPAEMLVATDAFNAMQARLNRLMQERSQMVAAIAHDLRTPLMRLAFRINGLESPLREKVEADIEEMGQLVAGAVNFVRDRSIRGTRETLDFRQLVESVVDDLSDVGQPVELAPGDRVAVHAEPLAMRRMIANLIDNAIKYGSRARLSLRPVGTHCQLLVDDDGPGIPEDLLPKVFAPFFRGESSRNRGTGGTGLGLATVRDIVLDHGGEITLANRAGGGLRATVSLPLAR